MQIAIDVAKMTHQVLVEFPYGRRRAMRVSNTLPDLERFVEYLRSLNAPGTIAFEPTGDYHRAVMQRLRLPFSPYVGVPPTVRA